MAITDIESFEQSGFTLIELIITLSILTILVTLAVPSFQNLIASSRISTTTNDFHASLAYARSEAIRRGQRVTVCVSTDGVQCALGGNWEQGWISFIDSTRVMGNPLATVDAGEVVLQVSPAAATGILIQGQAPVSQYVSFSADGQSRTMAGGIQTGTIEICSTSTALSNDTRARDLALNASGLVILRTILGITNTCPPPP